MKCKKIWERICAFTGCDFNPVFYRKGKQRPFKILCQSEKYIKAFVALSSPSFDEKSTFDILQSFVSNMYGVKSKNFNIPVNAARFELFMKNYKIKDVNEPFHKKLLKNVDASSLPPCETELRQQFLRTKYIANIWSHAYTDIYMHNMNDPTYLEAENCGWIKQNNEYTIYI